MQTAALSTGITCAVRLVRGLAAVCLVALAAPAQADCEKRIAWELNPPYQQAGPDGEVHGVHADLVREALSRLHCQAVFVHMPWARSLFELKEGHVDILAGVNPTEERRQYALFSRPTNAARNVVFVRRDLLPNFHYTRLADIVGTNLHVGVMHEAMYGGDFNTLIDNPAFKQRLVFINDRTNAWKMLGANRLDAEIEDELTGMMEIRQLGLSEAIKKSPLIVGNDPDLVAFSRQTIKPDFVDAFNHALDTMIADGTFKRIFESHIPCKVSTQTLACE